MKISAATVSAFLLLGLSGCASVPMAPPDQDSRAKNFSTTPNKATLYIYRNETFGRAISMPVSINGKVLGQTAAETYFRVNLPPGKYVVESKAENDSSLYLTMEAGKNYFVWQEVKQGFWIAQSLLQKADESTGRAGVMRSKLISLSIFENDLAPLDSPPATPAELQTPSSNSIAQRLRELQNLRKDGVISEDEFLKKKLQLLEKF